MTDTERCERRMAWGALATAAQAIAATRLALEAAQAVTVAVERDPRVARFRRGLGEAVPSLFNEPFLTPINGKCPEAAQKLALEGFLEISSSITFAVPAGGGAVEGM